MVNEVDNSKSKNRNMLRYTYNESCRSWTVEAAYERIMKNQFAGSRSYRARCGWTKACREALKRIFTQHPTCLAH